MSLEQDIEALERAFVALLEHVHDEETRWSYQYLARYLHDYVKDFAYLASTQKCRGCDGGYVPGKREHTAKLCPFCKGRKRTKKEKTK